MQEAICDENQSCLDCSLDKVSLFIRDGYKKLKPLNWGVFSSFTAMLGP
jgi:hypothetical protein